MSDTFDHEGDAYDSLMSRDEAPEYYSRYRYARTAPRERRDPPTCKFCGKADLRWEHDGDTWVLLEAGNRIHKCPPATADEFDDVSAKP